MIAHAKVLTALMLGLALTGALGAGVALSGGNRTPAVSQDNSNTGDQGITDSPPVTDQAFFTGDDPGTTLMDMPQDFAPSPAPDGSGPMAIALGARWGYLNDPTVAKLEGQWHLVNQTAGVFRGGWEVIGGRQHGYLTGDFGVAPDGGHGRFGGKWGFSNGQLGGFVSGQWQGLGPRALGSFEGKWNTTGGTDGGVLKGMLKATERGSGVFGGLATKSRSVDMVPWDGNITVNGGIVKLFRTVRFEHGGNYSEGGDDLVYKQTDNSTLSWRSSTTTNWDGLIVGILVRNASAQVSFKTEQWSKDFTAADLVNMHIRVPTDKLGHEIELRSILLRPPPRPPCQDGFVRVTMNITWGYLGHVTSGEGVLDGQPLNDTFTPWNGFVQVTRGGVAVRQVLSWERGGSYQNGSDDFVYPRNNMLTVEWRSSVTNDWDGLVLALCLPLRGEPLPHVTIHTDQWTNVYGLDELKGLDKTYDIPGTGQAIEVEATVS